MRQVLGAGVSGRARWMGWGLTWEGGSGWGIHTNPWLIHVNVCQNPLQYCKVISLQLIKINGFGGITQLNTQLVEFMACKVFLNKIALYNCV